MGLSWKDPLQQCTTLPLGLGRHNHLSCSSLQTQYDQLLQVPDIDFSKPQTVSQNKSFLKLLSECFTIATGRASMKATSDDLRFVGR